MYVNANVNVINDQNLDISQQERSRVTMSTTLGFKVGRKFI